MTDWTASLGGYDGMACRIKATAMTWPSRPPTGPTGIAVRLEIEDALVDLGRDA